MSTVEKANFLKIIISCFGHVGSSTGGGNIGFHIAQYLQSQAALKSVLCTGYDKGRVGELNNYTIQVIPQWSIRKGFSRFLSEMEKILGLRSSRFSRITAEKFFDKASVRYLTEADILYCIKPVVPHTIKQANRLGIVTAIRTATCHARFNKEMIDMEREKYGLPCIVAYCDETRVKRIEEVYQEVDWIITWYDFVAQTFVNRGIPKGKIRILHVPLGFEDPVKIERQSKEKLEVLYAAHTNLLKGLHYLLGAWENHQLHKTGHLTVCGAVDANTRRIIKKESWGLQNVNFVGPSKMAPYYEKADVVVVPSLSEGNSAVVREAMSYGVPVIVSEHCGNKEIVKEFETGIVVPVRNEEAIAEAIVKLHESAELRQYFGENGRRVASQFTWKRYSQQLFEEFKRVLRRKEN